MRGGRSEGGDWWEGGEIGEGVGGIYGVIFGKNLLFCYFYIFIF
jgi:hypothetical protein